MYNICNVIYSYVICVNTTMHVTYVFIKYMYVFNTLCIEYIM